MIKGGVASGGIITGCGATPLVTIHRVVAAGEGRDLAESEIGELLLELRDAAGACLSGRMGGRQARAEPDDAGTVTELLRALCYHGPAPHRSVPKWG